MTTANPSIANALIEALNRRPFAPFRIVTQNGKKYPVTRIAQAGTNDTDVAIIDKHDVMTWLKMTEIVAIEPIPSRHRGASRGKS